MLFETLLLLGLSAGAQEAPPPPRVTHGVMAAEVTATGVLLWARTDGEAILHARVFLEETPEEMSAKTSGETPGQTSDATPEGRGSGTDAARTAQVPVKAADDFTGQIWIEGLEPHTRYRYALWFSRGEAQGEAVEGTFRTAPAADRPAPVKIAWTGDIAGQNVCRDAREGFPIFPAIRREKADLFIGLGDMIYADNLCEAKGMYGNDQVPGTFTAAADLPNFWAHWRYNREDRHFRALLATTPYFGLWDDHEVVNDFGPLADTRSEPPYTAGEHLLPLGLEAFLDYTPLVRDPKTPHRLYRKARWGQHAELFFLDNRQYRDANLAPDREDRPKTMLGREQLTWLLESLRASDATWKILVTSVPLSIPTGWPWDLGRDGWANYDPHQEPTVEGIPQSDTGFERELWRILETLRDTEANALFLTTDVHFAQLFRYQPFPEHPTGKSFQFHEIVVGPGNAGIYPNRRFDTTLHPESLFFHGPRTAEDVTSWEEAKKWFNYGLLEISHTGRLTVQVKGVGGKALHRLSLRPRGVGSGRIVPR
jgi:alkaline phosphatase D